MKLMAEVIPVIFVKTFDELKEKIKAIEPCVNTVQLDVADGLFVNNETFWQPEDLVKLETKIFLEAHLMIEAPHYALDRWLASVAGRLIMHWEAIDKIPNSQFSISDLIKKVHDSGKEIGLALNPETSISVLENFINEIDLVLLMSVNPGFSGQEFQPSVIPKISALRQKHPNVKIEVDGGINLQNAVDLLKAGADFLAVGSAVFNASRDVCSAVEDFKKIIRDSTGQI